MKKYILAMLFVLLFALGSCKKDLAYECNTLDNAFIPFFGDENFTLNSINLGKLNVCNDTLDSLEESKLKLLDFYERVDLKNTSKDPDISGIEAYFDYYSNSRMYPEGLVSYDIFDSYNGTMELAFIYEAYLQIKMFVDHYDDPIEGELNDFDISDDFYKMRYYITDNFLYFVQYHTLDGSQFTVTRIYFTEENKMIFDHLTFFKEGKSFTYKYTYYQEDTHAIQASYRRYDEKKGMLDIKEADFRNKTIVEYYISNYINPMYRYHEVNPIDKFNVTYTQEQDKYRFNIELYDDEGFVYGELFDNYETPFYNYRFNLNQLSNWDYYFQEALYKNETKLEDNNYEVFVNNIIKKGDLLIINQHIEYLLHSSNSEYQLPNNLVQTPLNSQQNSALENYSEEYIIDFFTTMLNDTNVEEVELLDIWREYVPEEFYDFIQKNK